MSKDDYQKIQSHIIIDFSKKVQAPDFKKLSFIKELDLGKVKSTMDLTFREEGVTN